VDGEVIGAPRDGDGHRTVCVDHFAQEAALLGLDHDTLLAWRRGLDRKAIAL
jgi:hypothetical protein